MASAFATTLSFLPARSKFLKFFYYAGITSRKVVLFNFVLQNRKSMEILSLQENPAIAKEADSLCRLIEENAGALRSGSLGKQFRLEGATVRLIQIGRNAVYKINSQTPWFLKLPCGKNREGIEGEAAGFRYVKEKFGAEEHYFHPPSIRASREKGYILAAEIPGSQLNYQLYRNIFYPSGKRFAKVGEMFYRCGQVLGSLHKNGIDYDIRPINSGLPNTLQRRIAKAAKPDFLGERIARWYRENSPFETENTFMHGNCTYRNIFVQERTASLLDFETCGRGSRYNDLARMCSDIIQCRIALAFPWRRAYSALSLLLEGYGKVYPYNAGHLFNYLALYMFDRYIQVYCIKKEKETISGIPVARSRLHWLLERLLEGDADAVFENVKV